jgi:hypothetical protein
MTPRYMVACTVLLHCGSRSLTKILFKVMIMIIVIIITIIVFYIE